MAVQRIYALHGPPCPNVTIPGVITVDDALAVISAACAPRGSEFVPLAESLGRVLARAVTSDVDWPPFDTSAMDGYALRVADLAGSAGSLAERTRPAAAGDAPGAPLSRGKTVRVMTGAPLPEGADTVVPVEDSMPESGRVSFRATPSKGDH